MFWLDLACSLATPFLMPASNASGATDLLPSPDTRAVPGGRLTASSFADAAGRSIDFQLFVPTTTGTAALPLVVMLHGHSQELDAFIAGTSMNDAAAAAGFAVLYPAQSSRSHPQKCWNWFDPAHQQRDRGEPELLAALTRSVMRSHAIDPRRVHVAGLSAGGAMAAVMGRAYPDLFASIGVHSGLAAGIAGNVGSALAAMRGELPVAASDTLAMPTIVFHGDGDKVVHADNGVRVIAACTGDAPAAETRRFHANGRACTRHLHRQATGAVIAEHWIVHDAGHAWSGGSARGSFADPLGPDASAEMLRFFAEHPRPVGKNLSSEPRTQRRQAASRVVQVARSA